MITLPSDRIVLGDEGGSDHVVSVYVHDSIIELVLGGNAIVCLSLTWKLLG